MIQHDVSHCGLAGLSLWCSLVEVNGHLHIDDLMT